MQITSRPNESTNAPRAPHDWLSQRYRLPEATARLIAELTFAAGVVRAAERGARVTPSATYRTAYDVSVPGGAG